MTDLLVGFIDFIINFFGKVIPSYDFSADTYAKISDSLPIVVDFLADVNFIIPLGDIVLIIVISCGFKLFKFSLFVGNWLVKRVFDLIPF